MNFIRLVKKDMTETIFNLAYLKKIEVNYGKQTDTGVDVISTREGRDDPDAIRVYELFFAGEDQGIMLSAENNPVMKVVEKIYKEAISGDPL